MVIKEFAHARLGVRTAWYSNDEKYRYGLLIVFDRTLPVLAVAGLNPSTATERQDDPTIRRCLGFARRWGYGALWMLNIAAYRATEPQVMFEQADPVGPENRVPVLLGLVSAVPALALAAWGVHGARLQDSAQHFLVALRAAGIRVVCLGTTANGQPKHPLYVAQTQRPIEYAVCA